MTNNALIQTSSGKFFDILHPENYAYDIHEIAHSLYNLCRFTGHTERFYSVARHSILCSMIVKEENKLGALLHDASEAFLGDVASPLKKLLPEYGRLEASVQQAIFNYFGVPYPYNEEVKMADLAALVVERSIYLSIPERQDVWDEFIKTANIDKKYLEKAQAMINMPYNNFVCYFYAYNSMPKAYNVCEAITTI